MGDEGAITMEETLYDIEIHRGDDLYVGKIFSDADGVKEFTSEHLDQLLRDITIDIQLTLDEFNQHRHNFTDHMEE
jgi:hypothetical protein